MALEPLYTIEEVAGRLRCNKKTIGRWLKSGRITAINLGGNRNGPYRFRPSDIERFERSSEVGKRSVGG